MTSFTLISLVSLSLVLHIKVSHYLLYIALITGKPLFIYGGASKGVFLFLS